MKPLFAGAVALGVVAAFGSLALLGARYWRVADMATSATPLYALAGLAAAALLVVLRRPRGALLVVLLAALPIVWCVPYVPWRSNDFADADLTVISANLNGGLDDFLWLQPLVRAYQPEILFLQEYAPAAEAQLVVLHDRYPHRLVHVKPHVLGMAIYSRFPLEDAETLWLANKTYATLFATIRVHGETIRIVDFHAPPPIRDAYYRTRNAALGALPKALGTDRVLVAGDFNAPPWSPFFRSMITRAELIEARRGHGVQGTWPRGLGALRIPIDHMLYRGGLRCRGFRTLAPSGSDHLPVLAAFDVGENLSADGYEEKSVRTEMRK